MESPRWRLSSLASTLFIVVSIISLSSAAASGENDKSEIIGRDGTVSRFLRTTTRSDGTTGHTQHVDGQIARTLNVFDDLAATTSTSTGTSTNTAVDEDTGAEISSSDNIFAHSTSQQLRSSVTTAVSPKKAARKSCRKKLSRYRKKYRKIFQNRAKTGRCSSYRRCLFQADKFKTRSRIQFIKDCDESLWKGFSAPFRVLVFNQTSVVGSSGRASYEKCLAQRWINHNNNTGRSADAFFDSNNILAGTSSRTGGRRTEEADPTPPVPFELTATLRVAKYCGDQKRMTNKVKKAIKALVTTAVDEGSCKSWVKFHALTVDSIVMAGSCPADNDSGRRTRKLNLSESNSTCNLDGKEVQLTEINVTLSGSSTNGMLLPTDLPRNCTRRRLDVEKGGDDAPLWYLKRFNKLNRIILMKFKK